MILLVVLISYTLNLGNVSSNFKFQLLSLFNDCYENYIADSIHGTLLVQKLSESAYGPEKQGSMLRCVFFVQDINSVLCTFLCISLSLYMLLSPVYQPVKVFY